MSWPRGRRIVTASRRRGTLTLAGGVSVGVVALAAGWVGVALLAPTTQALGRGPVFVVCAAGGTWLACSVMMLLGDRT